MFANVSVAGGKMHSIPLPMLVPTDAHKMLELISKALSTGAVLSIGSAVFAADVITSVVLTTD